MTFNELVWHKTHQNQMKHSMGRDKFVENQGYLSESHWSRTHAPLFQ